MADSDTPQRYSLAALLNSGIQPFDDLPDEELAALAADIPRREPLADPLSVDSTGRILLDGHQRARILVAQGRKLIDASDVRIIPQANPENALEWAVRLNVKRRQLSVEQKAAVARRLQAERRWSQAKIANVFGVSRPAVSQWLARTESAIDESSPVVAVEGRDGKVHDVSAKRRTPKPPRTQPHPWSSSGGQVGYRLAAVVKLLHLIHPDEDAGELARLDDEEREVAKVRIEDLQAKLAALLEHLYA